MSKKTIKRVRKHLEQLGNIKPVKIREQRLQSDDVKEFKGREKLYIQLVKPLLLNKDDDDEEDSQDNNEESKTIQLFQSFFV